MSWWNPTSWGESIVKPLASLIDEVHTSKEEKLIAQMKIYQIMQQVYDKGATLDMEILKAQQAIIVAEAQSESWIARSWRPYTSAIFTLLIVYAMVAPSFGIDVKLAADAIPDKLWDVMLFCLGGYVGGRSLEKVAKVIAPAIANMKGGKDA